MAGSGTDRAGDLGGFGRREKFFNEEQTEIEGGAGAAGSEQLAVGDDAFARENVGQFGRDGKVRGVAAAREEAGIMEYRGRGADGREPATRAGLVQHEGAHAGIGAEVFHAGAAGQEDAIEGFRFQGREGGVGVDCHSAAAGDVDAVAEGGERDVGAGAAKQIDRRRRLDLLEPVGKQGEHGGHGSNVRPDRARATLQRACDGAIRPDSAGHMDSFAGKRLVIFGCGYVGAAVARWGASVGLNVTALTRNAATALLLREVGVHSVVADLATERWHDQIEAAPEFALNCVSSGGGGTEAYRHSYLAGMQSILAWAVARGPIGALVYTGSTSVYPQGEGARVDEAAPTAGAGERAQILLEAETALRTASRAARRWFVLRLAGIYGPGRHHLLEQVRAGEVSGRGDVHLNLIHRDDIAASVAACFAAGPEVASGVFNLADDGAATKAEIVGWLAGQLQLPAPRFTGEPAGGRRALTPDRIIVNERARTVLGWRPRYATFRDGYASLLSR